MATFKAVTTKPRSDGFSQVYIQVIHNRQNLRIKTSKMVDKKGLDKKGNIKDSIVLSFCANKITEYQEKLNKVNIDNWTVKEVVDYLSVYDEDISFSDYARKIISEKAKEKDSSTAKMYKTACLNLERYAGTDNLLFSQLTTTFIHGWIKDLESTATAKELYPICVRSILKRAILEYNDYDKGIIRIKTNPFMKLHIPKRNLPDKKAISAEECRQFFDLELPNQKTKGGCECARDVAKLIICLAGINTADLYNLQKDRCSDGYIRYNRKKTHRSRTDKAYIELKVPEMVYPLFEKYKTSDEDPFLFNFHNTFSAEPNFNILINYYLKLICKHNNISPYSTYTFRHSFATIACNDCNFTDEQIAFAMNHVSAHKVTRGYIRTDYSPITVLNNTVINYIFNTDTTVITQDIPSEANYTTEGIYPRHIISCTAYHAGRKLCNVTDAGFKSIEEIIIATSKQITASVKDNDEILFKIENLDTEYFSTHKRIKGNIR